MEDTTNKDDFEAPDYQVQIAEMAFEKNTIVYLPTGSGETIISVLAIKHFLQKNNCGSKKFGEGGKRAFFLVNTVALVHQQTNQIRNKTPFDVRGYCGYMGVDFWEKEKWEEEFNKYGILIMTAQIFLNLLLGNIITLKDVAITVFDECHHGVVNHPMRQIMQRFKGVPVHDQPRVLGLTATLINRNLRADKVIEEVRTLETTFLSQIATADANNEQMVKAFSTNPQEFKVRFTDHNQQQRVYTIRDRVFQQMTEFIKKIQIDNVNKAEKDIQPIGARQIDDNSKKTNKELKNVISDIEVNMNELGLYGGYVAVLAGLFQMQKILHHCKSEIRRNVFNVVNTNLVFLRKFFETEMGKKSEYELIKLYTSEKVQRLRGILKQLKDKDTAIVFVTRRSTAKVMFKIVANAAKSDPKLSHINCDFIVGCNVANPFKDTKENMMQNTYNERVLEKFNSGVLNVIVSNVEEGLDISNCNNVIMFDAPKDFRSYVQSKGRARHSTSRYIILTSDPDYDKEYQKFLDVEKVLKGLLCGGNYLLRDQPSQGEVDATLFANIEPYGKNSPCITALSAISHVNMHYRGGSNPFTEQRNGNGDSESGQFGEMSRKDNGYGRRSDGDNSYRRRTDGDSESGQCGEMSRKDIGYGRRSDGDNSYRRRTDGDSESGQCGEMSRKDNGYGRRSDGDNSYRRRTDGDSESGQCGEMSRKDNGYGRRSDGDNSYRRRTDGDSESGQCGEMSRKDIGYGRRSDGDGRKTENGYGDTGAGGPPKLMICPVQKPVEDNLSSPAVEAKVVVVGNIHPKMDQGQIYELVKKVSDTPLHVDMMNMSRHPYPFKMHYRGGSNPFTEQRNGNGDSESGQFGEMSRKDNGYGRRSDGDNSYRRRTDGDSESGQCGEMSRKDIGYGRRSDGDNSYRRRTDGDSESGQCGEMSRKDNGYGRRSDGDNSYRRRTDGDSESGQCGEMSRKDNGYGRRSDGDNSYRRRTDGDSESGQCGEMSRKDIGYGRRSDGDGRKTENGYGDTGAGGPPKLMICPVQKPVEDNLSSPAVEAKVVVVGNIHPKMDQGQIYELVKKVSDTPLHVDMMNMSRHPYPFKIHYALVYVKNDKEVDSIVSSLNNLTLNNYKLKVGPAEKFIEEGKILKARK